MITLIVRDKCLECWHQGLVNIKTMKILDNSPGLIQDHKVLARVDIQLLQ